MTDTNQEVREPTERCIACDDRMRNGDAYLPDADGGVIHAACCGPERESYVGPDGEPLRDGDPLPKPRYWIDPNASATVEEAITRLGSESWSLVCKSYPTAGGDDGDVGYEVVSYHMAKPTERVEGLGISPLDALRHAGLLALASAPPPAVPDAVGVREAIIDLYASPLHSHLAEHMPMDVVRQHLREFLHDATGGFTPSLVRSLPVAWRFRIDGRFSWQFSTTDPSLSHNAKEYQIEPLFASPEPQASNAGAVEATVLPGLDWELSQETLSHIAAIEANSREAFRKAENVVFGGAALTTPEPQTGERDGEVERLTRERDEARQQFVFWEDRENIALKRAEAAEHRLAEVEERAKEDERDRLLNATDHVNTPPYRVALRLFLREHGAMEPADRAALRAKPEAHTLAGKEGGK